MRNYNNLQDWSKWFVRQRLGFLLKLFGICVLFPIALVIDVARGIKEAAGNTLDDLKDNLYDVTVAEREWKGNNRGR